jgi:hypothetical protein
MRTIQTPYTVVITPSPNGIEDDDIRQMVSRVSELLEDAKDALALGQLGNVEEVLFDICDALRPDYTSAGRECLTCGEPDCLEAH